MTQVSRRQWVLGGVIGVALVVAVLLWPADDSVRLDDIRSGGGVVYLEDEQVFLVADGEDVLALSAESPGRGTRLLYCASSRTFRGPHGEAFDSSGAYFAGPAPRDMDRYAVEVDDGAVEVDLSDKTVAPGRSRRADAEITGELCRWKESEPGFASV